MEAIVVDEVLAFDADHTKDIMVEVLKTHLEFDKLINGLHPRKTS